MLSAAEQFAQRCTEGRLPPGALRYRGIMPAGGPGPGEQFAFEVNLDACTGCKSCVVACNAVHDLPEGQSWRSVETLFGAGLGAPLVQTVTSSCHHCLEPACASGCPSDALAKDPATGLVLHDPERCVGCGYCMFTCPYGAPRYDARRGVIGKCDLCSDRLREGRAPACADACPSGAIAIRTVPVEALAPVASAGRLPPPGTDPNVTRPTTAYVTARQGGFPPGPPARVEAAPASSHEPLVVMLVLTQVAAGVVLMDISIGASPAVWHRAPLVAALLVFGGMTASVFHLGRPLRALAALRGLRHSWLSREVAALPLFGILAAWSGVARASNGSLGPVGLVELAAVVAAVAGVGCSVMVYGSTHHALWSPGRTAERFALTALTGGSALLLALEVTTGSTPLVARFAVLCIVALAVQRVVEQRRARALARAGHPALRHAAALRQARMSRVVLARDGLAAAGFLFASISLVFDWAGSPSRVASTVCAWLVFGCVLAAELVERSLFFRLLSRAASEDDR